MKTTVGTPVECERLSGTVAKTEGGRIWILDKYGNLHERRVHEVTRWGAPVVGVSSERGRLRWDWSSRCNRGIGSCGYAAPRSSNEACSEGPGRFEGCASLDRALASDVSGEPCQPIPIKNQPRGKMVRAKYGPIDPSMKLDMVSDLKGRWFKFINWGQKRSVVLKDASGRFTTVPMSTVQVETQWTPMTLVAFYYQEGRVVARDSKGRLRDLTVRQAKKHASLVDVPVLES